MSGYTIKRYDDADDLWPDYPGEMRLLTGVLGNEQVAVSYRRMPQDTGGKGGYGHFHHVQEEVFVVISGRVQFKLDDEVIEVDAGHAVRIAPATVRSLWNAEPEDAELIMVSIRVDDLEGDVGTVPDFWPE